MQKFLRTLMLLALMLVPIASHAQANCTGLTIPYAENFDAYTGYATSTSAPSGYPSITLPDCWSFLNMSESTSSYPQAFLSSSSTYAVSGNCLFFKSSSTTPLYAILPDVGAQSGPWQLLFQYKNEGTTDLNGTIIVGVMSDPTDATTFVALHTCARTTTKTLVELNIPAGTVTSGSRLAFCYQGGNNNNYYASIDNVTLDMAPTCLKVTDLAIDATATTTSSLTLTWTDALNTGATYKVYAITPTDTTLVQGGITATTYTVTGLNSNTVYSYAVMTDCGDGDVTELTNAVSGRTACDATTPLPYAEDFSGYGTLPANPTSNTPSVLPACWLYASNGTNTAETGGYYGGLIQYGYTSSYACLEANDPFLCLPIQITGSAVTTQSYIDYETARGNTKYAVLPAFTTALSGLQISFDYKMNTAYSATGAATTLELGYVTDDNTDNFVSMQSYQSVTSIQHVVELNLSSLAAAAPAGARLAFKFSGVHNGTYSSSYSTVYAGIDNILVEPLPSCLKVTDLAIDATATTSTSLTLTWTDALNTGANYRVYAITPTDTTLVQGGITATTYTVTGLTANTVYSYAVMTDCGGDVAELTTPVSGRTACEATTPLPYAEDFSGYGTLPANPYTPPAVLPACWLYASNGTNTAETASGYYGGIIQNSGTSFGGMVANDPFLSLPIQITGSAVTNQSYIDNETARGNTKYAVLPAFTTALSGLQISFDYKMGTAYSATGAATTLELGYVTDDNTDNFVSMQSYQAVTTTQYVVELNLSSLAAAAPAGARLAFKFSGVHNGTSSYSYSTVYAGIDNILVEPLPSCSRVTDLTVATATSSTITLNWVDAFNSGATYSVYIATPTDTTLKEGGIAATTYTVTGLDANTEYTFAVEANCSATESSAKTFVSGRTACEAYAMPFTENFNTLTAGIPSCWDNSEGTTTNASYRWNYYATGHEGAGLRFNSYNNQNNLTNTLVTPPIAIDEAAQLSFWYKNPTGGDFTVMVSTDDINFDTLATGLTAVSDWTKAEIVLDAAYVGETVNIYFKGTSNYGNGDAYIYLDDVMVDVAPSCLPVTNLVVSDITATGATLTWEGEADGYDVWDMSNPTTPYQYANTNSVDLYALDANTEYTFGVTAVCGTDESDTVTITFRTACAAFAAPYTWSFEDMTTSATPLCWTKVGTGTVAVTANTSYSTNSHAGNNYLKFSGSLSNLVVLPETEEEISALQIRFWTRPENVTNSGCGTFSVGYITDLSDATTFVEIINYAYDDFSDYAEKTVTFAGTPAGARMAMRHNAGSTSWYWFVDDLTIEDAPSCLPVGGFAVDATATTASSITLTWVSDATSFVIYDMADSSEIATTANSTYTVTGLDANTAYTFGVAVNCGSEMSDTVTVSGRTACAAYAMPFTENFNTLTAGVPNCWDNSEGTTTTASYRWNYYATGHEGAGLRFNSYNNQEDLTNILVTPAITIDEAAQLSFWYKNPTGGDFTVMVSTDGTNFDTLATGLTAVSDWTKAELVLDAAYVDETVNIYFKGTSNYGNGDAYIYLDDVTVDVAPSCLPVTALVASSITATGATLTWNGEATSYKVYDRSDASVVASNVTDNEYELTNLTANTEYTFGVTAVCGTDESDTVFVTFRTACAAIAMPFTENFNTLTAGIPSCWDNSEGTVTNDAYRWNYFATGHEGAGVRFDSYNNQNGITNTLVTPAITINEAAQFSFWYKNPTGGDFTVMVSTDGTNFDTLATDLTGVSDWTKAEFILGAAYVGETVNIYFKGTSNWAYGDAYIYLDDVTVDVAPACLPVTNLTTSSISSTGATLTWNGEAASYKVYNRSNASVVASNVTDNEYELTGLDVNTEYTFGVTSVCGTDESDTVFVTFRTACAAFAAPYTWNFEDMTADATPLCWTKVGTGTAAVTANSSYSTDSHAGDNYLKFSGSLSNLIVLPETEDEISTLQLRFWTRPEGYTYANCGTFSVGYVTNIADASTFVEVANYNRDEWEANTYKEKTVTFGTAPTGARMALRHNALVDNYFWYVDDVTIEDAPSCLPVGGLAVDATATTSSSITLTWLSNATSFVIYDMADSSQVATTANSTYTVTGLDANTTYTFGVAVNCGSEMSDTITVSGRTACGIIATLPWTDGMEAVPTGSNQMPFCWSRYNNSTSSYYNYYPYSASSSSNAHEGSRALYWSYSTWGTYADTAIAILPQLDVTSYPMNGNQLSFYGRMSTSSASIAVQVGTMSDPADPTTFVASGTVTVSGNVYTRYDVNLTEANATDAYAAILVLNPNASAYLYIDDVTLQEAPSCLYVTEAAVSAVTSESMTLTWVDTRNEAGVTYTVYDSEGDTVESGITATTYTVPNLDANTAYTFGIAANCGAGNESEVITVSGHTACVAYAMPFTENFNSLTAGIPICWDNSEGTVTNDAYRWNYYVTGHEGAGVRFDSYNNQADITNTLITPAITINEAAQLSFWYKNPAGGDFTVLISADGTNFDTLATGLTGVSAWTEFETILNAAYIGETVNIYFKGTSNWGYNDAYIYLDDVTVDVAPSEPEDSVSYAMVYVISPDETMGAVTVTPEADSVFSDFGMTFLYYEAGTSVTVTATPATGYVFSGWSTYLDELDTIIAANPYTFVAEADGQYVFAALFASESAQQSDEDSLTVILAVNDPLGGSITPNGTVRFALGDTAAYSVTVNAGYQIDSVTMDATEMYQGMPYTFHYVMSAAEFPLTDTIVVDSSLLGSVISYTVYFGEASEETVTVSVRNPYGQYIPEFVVTPMGDSTVTVGSQFTVTANSSNWMYELDYWSNQYGDTLSTENPYTFTATEDVQIRAIPRTTPFSVVMAMSSDPNGGSVSISPAPDTVLIEYGSSYDIYRPGRTVTLTATPANGYVFSGWMSLMDEDADIITSNPLTITIPDTNATFYYGALFASESSELSDPDSLTIVTSVNNPQGGSITPSGTTRLGLGESFIYNVTVNEGYHVAGVVMEWTYTFNGAPVTEVDTLSASEFALSDTLTVSDSVLLGVVLNLTVLFEQGSAPVEYTVTVSSNDVEMGMVYPAGTHTVAANTQFTAQARAFDGYHFVRWSTNDTTQTLTITVTGDIDLIAYFAPDGEPDPNFYTVTVVWDHTRGNVTKTPEAERYIEGSDIGLTANAYENYVFVAWLNENGDTLSTNTAYAITDIQSNRTLTAVFERATGIDEVDMSQVKIYSTESVIYVNGAEGQQVYLFDINGRVMNHTAKASENVAFRVTNTGVYLVKVGNAAAKRVVVMR